MAETTVPFLDLGATYQELRAPLDDAYERVMKSGWFLLGEELQCFESEFGAFVGADHAVGLASGLDALVLGLRALDVGPGDEVIVPSNTFVATWLAVTAVGARLVPVEPDDDTFVIGSVEVEAAMTPRTAAILPVHLYGLPVDMAAMVDVGDRHGVPVLADAAQAHGATLHGRPIGELGSAAAWSFYPGKNLGAYADAGAVTTNDLGLAGRVRRLRNYGSEQKYVNVERGVNSRLDELQAAVLRIKLSVLAEWNARRALIAGRYSDALGDLDLRLPVTPDDRTSAWHLFVVRSPRRDELQAHLDRRGVQSLIHYPIPPHRQEAYADVAPELGSFPVAERMADEVLSLPIGPHMTDLQVERTIEAVRSFAW